MKVQVVTAVVAVVLVGMVKGDTKKVVVPYSLPGDAVVVGEAHTQAAVPFTHHVAAAAVPTYYRKAAVHYTVPHAVQYAVPQPLQYAVPQAVQYAVPQAVRYAVPHAVRYAAPAVSYSPMVYSAAVHQPAAATIVRKDIELDDDDYRPLTYAAGYYKVDDDDDLVATPYGMFDKDHFEFEDHDDRK